MWEGFPPLGIKTTLYVVQLTGSYKYITHPPYKAISQGSIKVAFLWRVARFIWAKTVNSSLNSFIAHRNGRRSGYRHTIVIPQTPLGIARKERINPHCKCFLTIHSPTMGRDNLARFVLESLIFCWKNGDFLGKKNDNFFGEKGYFLVNWLLVEKQTFCRKLKLCWNLDFLEEKNFVVLSRNG